MSAKLLIIGGLAIALTGCAKTTMTAPTPAAAAVDPYTFANQVLPGGGASRELTVTAAGQITATLTATTPAGIALGIGIGIPRANNQCALSSAIVTAAGGSAQIALAADTGRYCVKIYDPGTLTAPVDFAISISSP